MADLDAVITEMISTLQEARQAVRGQMSRILETPATGPEMRRLQSAILDFEDQAGSLLAMMSDRDPEDLEVQDAQDLLEYFQYTGARLTAMAEMSRA